MRVHNLIAFLASDAFITQFALRTVDQIGGVMAFKNRIGVLRVFVVITHEDQVAVLIERRAVGVVTVHILESKSELPGHIALKLLKLLEKRFFKIIVSAIA